MPFEYLSACQVPVAASQMLNSTVAGIGRYKLRVRRERDQLFESVEKGDRAPDFPVSFANCQAEAPPF